MIPLRPLIPRLALALLVLMAATGLGASTEVTFRAGDGRLAPEDTADVQLNQATPAKVVGSGTSRELAVKHDAAGNDHRVTLLAFRNLTGPDRVPAGAVVQRATLRLHCRDGGHDQEVFLVESAWAEKTATWGAVFAAGAKGERVGSLPGPQAGKAHEVDVLHAVRRWVADPASNFGLMLVSTGSGGGKTGDPVLWSSAQEKDESLRPVLTIAYDPAGTTPVEAPALTPAATPAVAMPAPVPTAKPDARSAPRKVALAGDDWVARGAGETALRALLGSSHHVRAFGAEGATALPSASVWKDTEAARDLSAFQPQVIVLMLGASDTRAATREQLAAWGAAYRELVLGLQQGRGLENVLLCTPVVEPADTEAGADAALASDKLEVPLRLAAVETGAVVVDTALAAQDAVARGLTPATAAAVAVAETLLGRPPDLRLLKPTIEAEPTPVPAAMVAPVPAVRMAPTSAVLPRVRVALAGDAPLPDADVTALLARELGADHEVRAFHLPSGRLFHQDGKPFSRSALPGELKTWQPAVVLLTLGQDPGHSTSSGELSALERELRAVMNALGQHTPRPRILLCQPLPRPDLVEEAREDRSVAPAVVRLGKSLRLPVVPPAGVKPTTKPQDPRIIEARARACAQTLAAAVRNGSATLKESP